MKEATFRSYIMSVIDNEGGDVCPVESHDVSPGIPDINWCIDSVEGWIETKVWSKNSPARMRPSQVRWISKRASFGGRVTILLLNNMNNRISFIPGYGVQNLARQSDVNRWEQAAACSWPNQLDQKVFIRMLINKD